MPHVIAADDVMLIADALRLLRICRQQDAWHFQSPAAQRIAVCMDASAVLALHDQVRDLFSPLLQLNINTGCIHQQFQPGMAFQLGTIVPAKIGWQAPAFGAIGRNVTVLKAGNQRRNAQ